jgi:hypothetical protein
MGGGSVLFIVTGKKQTVMTGAVLIV